MTIMEDFDEFVPAPKAKAQPKTKPEINGHLPPHNPDSEDMLLSCCFIDFGTFFEAKDRGITAKSFTDTRRGAVFSAMDAVLGRDENCDVASVASELKRTGQLERVGGYPALVAMSELVPTTIHFSSLIDSVRSDEVRREIIRIADLAKSRAKTTTDPEELLEDLRKEFQPRFVPRPLFGEDEPKPITAYTYPADDDPNILLGKDDYLGKGGGMLFVSHAGAGKSSWIMDACMCWALGEPWMGIKSSGEIKSLIIQAEDSDRYIGKVVSSFSHARRLTPEKKAMLARNCRIIRLKGVSGPTFLTQLKRLTTEFPSDIVVINPIYIYTDGDIGRSEFAQPFLMGLDAINKDEKFAYILVHHTGKPASKGKDGKRADVEDWESVYMGFGSSYLANWPRCSALLEPTPNQPGRYVIKLGKGGYNAGVTRLVDHEGVQRKEPTTRIHLKHSTDKMEVNGQSKPVYYWEPDEAPPPEPKDEIIKGGRPKKYTFGQFVDIFPTAPEQAMTRQELFKYATDLASIPDASFRNLLYEAVDDGVILRSKSARGFKYYIRKQDGLG